MMLMMMMEMKRIPNMGVFARRRLFVKITLPEGALSEEENIKKRRPIAFGLVVGKMFFFSFFLLEGTWRE